MNQRADEEETPLLYQHVCDKLVGGLFIVFKDVKNLIRFRNSQHCDKGIKRVDNEEGRLGKHPC